MIPTQPWLCAGTKFTFELTSASAVVEVSRSLVTFRQRSSLVKLSFFPSFLSFVRSFRLIKCQPYFEAELDARINSSNFPPFIARILISHRVHTRLREFLLLFLVRNLVGSWRLFSRETLKLYVQLFPLS